VAHLLDTYGYIAVFGLIFVEACGVPLPGEIMLVTASAYAGTGQMQIPYVIGGAVFGVVLGFAVSYTIGRTGGRAVIDRWGPKIYLDAATMDRAERLFARYGDATVFLGRFVAVLRAWAAFLAGINEMPVLKFMLYNVLGGVAWAVLYGVLAFEFGKTLVELIVRYVGLALLAAVLLGAAYALYRWRFAQPQAGA
jgi:membrane protein DedA with SNARE-associated domain